MLRVPKRYIQENHLRVGDVVAIEEPLILQQNALAALVRRGKELGPVVKVAANQTEQQRQPGAVRKGADDGTAGY